MKYLIPLLCLLLVLPIPAASLEISPPEVPPFAVSKMPENTEFFADALGELIQRSMLYLRPDLAEACRISVSVVTAVLFLTLLNTFSGKARKITHIAGTVMIAAMLLMNAHSMVGLASDTIQQLSDYGKLLLPVMTAALAAQGGVTSAAALYTGTAAFDTFLSSMIVKLLLPLVYIFLALSVGSGASGEDILKQMRELVKNTVSWGLKTTLMVFTTYMSITGVVSGTTDVAKLKATKVTISSVVPVVGGILSDASEAILVSAALLKNAAGLYGILALLAVFLEPFFKIGIQYLMLKATAALCGILAPKEVSGLIDDFAGAMGLLLAMTGSISLMFLISVVCFMKGVG